MQELSRLQEGVKGEVEGYRKQLSAVRAEQAPWEAQLAELSSRISVATAERDLLLKKQTDAEKRFKVPWVPELVSAHAWSLLFSNHILQCQRHAPTLLTPFNNQMSVTAASGAALYFLTVKLCTEALSCKVKHHMQDAEEGVQAATQSAESKEADILSMEKAVQSTR